MLLFKTSLQIIFLILVTRQIDANLENKRREKREIERLGLYTDSQHVISLTVHTLKPSVFDKNYASLVEVSEFYVYCELFNIKLS